MPVLDADTAQSYCLLDGFVVDASLRKLHVSKVVCGRSVAGRGQNKHTLAKS